MLPLYTQIRGNTDVSLFPRSVTDMGACGDLRSEGTGTKRWQIATGVRRTVRKRVRGAGKGCATNKKSNGGRRYG